MSIFFSNKEKQFIDGINKELIDDIIKQKMILYKVDKEKTEGNLYGEDEEKIFEPGIEITCLIEFLDPDLVTADIGLSQNREINVYCHRQSLKEKDIFPEEGDFVKWDDQYFEITKVFQTKHLEGKPHLKHTIEIETQAADVSTIPIRERKQ